MQVLLLPLLIIRIIVSIFMSITTMSFLSSTKRRLEQQHAALHPTQAKQAAASEMKPKTVILILVLLVVPTFVVRALGSDGPAPSAATTNVGAQNAAAASHCQAVKHGKARLHHHCIAS